ncbi:MAG: hypothetical protein R3E66_10555 [bacterium]
MFGLNFLLESGDPIGRPIALNLLLREGTNANRAIAFRLLAMHLHADADTDECEVVRGGLYDTDVFVRAAAAMCAGASGDEDLARRAIAAVDITEGEVALAAAKGLSAGLGQSDRHLFPALEAAFERVHRRRLASNDETFVYTEAYLLRAVGHATSGSRGTSEVQRMALRALFDAEHHRPVLITGLELLEQSTPDEGLTADLRWPAEMVRDLAMVLGVDDREVQQRALRLLVRGAASGTTA